MATSYENIQENVIMTLSIEVENLDIFIENNDLASIEALMEKENLEVVDGKIVGKNPVRIGELADYWDMNQLVRKIGSNLA